MHGRRRTVDLAGAQGAEDIRRVNGRDVQGGVIPLGVAPGKVGEALRDRVHVEASCARLERVFPRLGDVCYSMCPPE